MAQATLDTATIDGFGGELLRDGDDGYDEARRPSTPASTADLL